MAYRIKYKARDEMTLTKEQEKKIRDFMHECYYKLDHKATQKEFEWFYIGDNQTGMPQFNIDLIYSEITKIGYDKRGAIEYVSLSNKELKFFDKLGFSISYSCKQTTGQTIHDWWKE